jgi:arylsulfatase A-like enzyme
VSEALRTSQLVHSAVGLFNRIAGKELGPGRQRARRINERLLALLDQREGHPFFAFANYYDAHSPYSPEAPYDTLYLGRQPITRDPSGDRYSPEETHDLKAAYDASIASLDAALRDLFRELGTRGLLENTMVIVTADHGEEFNEHGLMNHGSSLYFPSVHVPLLIIQPGVVPASLVIGEPVTIRDIPSTILDAARVPDEDKLPGSSLARWWRNGAGRNDSLPSPLIAEVDFARNLPARFAVSKGDMRSTVVDGYRYLLRGDGQGEMFDVRTDPWEQHDLASDSAYSSRVANLRALVEAIPKRSAARH